MAVPRLDRFMIDPAGTEEMRTTVKGASPFPRLRRGACRAMSASREDDQA